MFIEFFKTIINILKYMFFFFEQNLYFQFVAECHLIFLNFFPKEDFFELLF
jgi:hypothetical protein